MELQLKSTLNCLDGSIARFNQPVSLSFDKNGRIRHKNSERISKAGKEVTSIVKVLDNLSELKPVLLFLRKPELGFKEIINSLSKSKLPTDCDVSKLLKVFGGLKEGLPFTSKQTAALGTTGGRKRRYAEVLGEGLEKFPTNEEDAFRDKDSANTLLSLSNSPSLDEMSAHTLFGIHLEDDARKLLRLSSLPRFGARGS